MNCSNCRKNPRHGDWHLCEACLEIFRANPQAFSKIPQDNPTPEIRGPKHPGNAAIAADETLTRLAAKAT